MSRKHVCRQLKGQFDWSVSPAGRNFATIYSRCIEWDLISRKLGSRAGLISLGVADRSSLLLETQEGIGLGHSNIPPSKHLTLKDSMSLSSSNHRWLSLQT